MRKLCPTISELYAFHAAARHLSFTLAARDLCVTQGAISRHIAALESFVGSKMFIRRAPGLELTQAGASFLEATLPALAQLEAATAQLMSQGNAGGVVNLSVRPTFATQWLFPRLSSLKRNAPEIHLNFVRYEHRHDFRNPRDFDAAIQFGSGLWPGARATYLTGRENSIVCTPKLQRDLKLFSPHDLEKAILLQHLEVPYAWQEWLQQQNIDQCSGLFGPRFNQFALIIHAALADHGVAMVPTCLIKDELASGTLIEPFGTRHQSAQGYYFCLPASSGKHSVLSGLSEWLQSCCNHSAWQHVSERDIG